jgi:hypothetical protein
VIIEDCWSGYIQLSALLLLAICSSGNVTENIACQIHGGKSDDEGLCIGVWTTPVHICISADHGQLHVVTSQARSRGGRGMAPEPPFETKKFHFPTEFHHFKPKIHAFFTTQNSLMFDPK